MWLNPVKTFKILVAECEDLLVLWLVKTNLKCKFLPVWRTEIPVGESLDWPLTSMWGGPLLCDYQDAPQSSIWYDAFFFSPEKLFIAHCGKEWKWIIALMGWHLVWAVQLTTNAQLEAEAAVRKLEDILRLEKDVSLSTTLPASWWADKVGAQDDELEHIVSHFAKVVIQLLSHIQLFVTPWTAAHQSFTNSQGLLKLMSIESMMTSNHLILCCPLLLLSSICPIIRVFFSK